MKRFGWAGPLALGVTITVLAVDVALRLEVRIRERHSHDELMGRSDELNEAIRASFGREMDEGLGDDLARHRQNRQAWERSQQRRAAQEALSAAPVTEVETAQYESASALRPRRRSAAQQPRQAFRPDWRSQLPPDFSEGDVVCGRCGTYWPSTEGMKQCPRCGTEVG